MCRLSIHLGSGNNGAAEANGSASSATSGGRGNSSTTSILVRSHLPFPPSSSTATATTIAPLDTATPCHSHSARDGLYPIPALCEEGTIPLLLPPNSGMNRLWSSFVNLAATNWFEIYVSLNPTNNPNCNLDRHEKFLGMKRKRGVTVDYRVNHFVEAGQRRTSSWPNL